ncbi:MAG TPA: hypothetical protein VOA19_18945, partial [Actinomycetes bacterium]|nr:hypothetical protein [Actinomycetes bacterium]
TGPPLDRSWYSLTGRARVASIASHRRDTASGQHLLSLINDILDVSKIEAGRMELELTEFDLPSAIENALILVRERANRRGIRLGSTIDPRLGTIGRG